MDFGRSLFGADVRRDGKVDLFGDRRLVQAVDCFSGESAAGSDARKLEDIELGTDDPPGRPRMSETLIRTSLDERRSSSVPPIRSHDLAVGAEAFSPLALDPWGKREGHRGYRPQLGFSCPGERCGDRLPKWRVYLESPLR